MASSSRSFKLSRNSWSRRTKATYKKDSATPHLHRQLTLANVQLAALDGILGTHRGVFTTPWLEPVDGIFGTHRVVHDVDGKEGHFGILVEPAVQLS